ncbi:hypothetical protein [Phenylobacterium sp.]|uniref:hypothetical protein n=1 Tax=Phenylobacterium sp. TaxID=1871053 RepID=UPI00301DB1CD
MIDTYAGDALTHGERLLIRTLRLLTLTTPCHSLRAHFEAACGCAGEEAYRMLEAFVQQVAARGRRRLQLSIPVDPRLTDDEGLILDVFGCAQAGDYRAMDERLRGLMGVAPPAATGAAACLVAEILDMSGLVLRARPTPDTLIPPACPVAIFPMAAE